MSLQKRGCGTTSRCSKRLFPQHMCVFPSARVPSPVTTPHSSSCQHCTAKPAPSTMALFRLMHQPWICLLSDHQELCPRAGKVHAFGWKLQNLAISARQKLAANFGVSGACFDCRWWDLDQGFFYNEIHHHYYHHYYYIIISLLLDKKKKRFLICFPAAAWESIIY